MIKRLFIYSEIYYGIKRSQIEKGQQFVDNFGYQLPPSLSSANLYKNYKIKQDKTSNNIF